MRLRNVEGLLLTPLIRYLIFKDDNEMDIINLTLRQVSEIYQQLESLCGDTIIVMLPQHLSALDRTEMPEREVRNDLVEMRFAQNYSTSATPVWECTSHNIQIVNSETVQVFEKFSKEWQEIIKPFRQSLIGRRALIIANHGHFLDTTSMTEEDVEKERGLVFAQREQPFPIEPSVHILECQHDIEKVAKETMIVTTKEKDNYITGKKLPRKKGKR